jgi:hypothetical protein
LLLGNVSNAGEVTRLPQNQGQGFGNRECY